jgi:DNA primase
MIPELPVLFELIRGYKEIIIFFDNDPTGIQAAQTICNLINLHFPGKCKALWLPEYLLAQGKKDPSDLLQKEGKTSLVEFLNYRT